MLKKSYSAFLYMTCGYLFYLLGNHSKTLLLSHFITINFYALKINHLTSSCSQWHKSYDDYFGLGFNPLNTMTKCQFALMSPKKMYKNTFSIWFLIWPHPNICKHLTYFLRFFNWIHGKHRKSILLIFWDLLYAWAKVCILYFTPYMC